MFIAPCHPHCDVCAMPNSGQEVVLVAKEALGTLEAELAKETPWPDDVKGVLFTCRGCLASAWKPGDRVAPLQREFDRFTEPTTLEGLNRWNVLDQMLAEAYWQGWSARSARGFVPAS